MPFTNIKSLAEQGDNNQYKALCGISESINKVIESGYIDVDTIIMLRQVQSEIGSQITYLRRYDRSEDGGKEEIEPLAESDETLKKLVGDIFNKYNVDYNKLGQNQAVVDIADTVNVVLLGGISYQQKRDMIDTYFGDSSNKYLENQKGVSIGEKGLETMVNYIYIYNHPYHIETASLLQNDTEIEALPGEAKSAMQPVIEKLRKLNRIYHDNLKARVGEFKDDFVNSETINDLRNDLKKIMDSKDPMIANTLLYSPVGKALKDYYAHLTDPHTVYDIDRYRRELKKLKSPAELNEIRRRILENPVAEADLIEQLSSKETEITLKDGIDRIDKDIAGEKCGIYKHDDFNPVYNAYLETKTLTGKAKQIAADREVIYQKLKDDMIAVGQATADYRNLVYDQRREAEEAAEKKRLKDEETWKNSSLEERKKINPRRENEEWLQNSVSEMYALDRERTLNTIKSENYSWEKIAESPEASEAYWKTLNWNEKTALSKEKSDEEWKTFTKEQKLENDKEREQKEWDALEPKAKYASEKDRYFADLKNNKTALETIESDAGAEIREDYFSSLSYAEKNELYPTEALKEWNNTSWKIRFDLDKDRAESEWEALPFKDKLSGDKDRAEEYWNNLRNDKGFGKELYEADPERAQKEWEDSYLKDPGFNILNPVKGAADKAPDGAVREYADRYWNKLSLDEKANCKLAGAKDRLVGDLIREKPDMETVNKAGREVADSFFNGLSLEDRKSPKYQDEYERRYNEADYEGKKEIDEARTKEYFSSLSYEEKKNVSQKDTDAWFSKLSDKEKRWTDAEKTVNELAGKAPEAEADEKLTEKESERLRELSDRKYTESDQLKGTEKYSSELDRIICRVLSDNGTAQDIVNLQAFNSLIAENRESIIDDNALEAINSLNTFMTNIGAGSEAAFHQANENDIKNLNIKFNDKGNVVLSNAQKRDLLKVRENINDNIKETGNVIKDQYNTLLNAAAGSNRFVNLQKECLDLADDARNMAKGFIRNEPGFRKVPVSEYNTAVESYNENKKRLADGIRKSRFNDLKAEGKEVENLKTTWNSMKSHSPSIFNSKAYDKMEKAFNDYTKAYDNLMAGKTIDGKSARPEGDQLEDAEINALRDLQEKMQKAARDYTEAKRVQKDGGIDKHSTKQGQDRLAMADLLSEFDLFPRAEKKIEEKIIPEKIGTKERNVVIQVSLSELEGQERANKTLEYHKNKLHERERSRAAEKQNNAPKMQPAQKKKSLN